MNEQTEADLVGGGNEAVTEPKINLRDLYENLGGSGTSDSGRNQLTDSQRDAFAGPLAKAVGIPRNHISIRALNDDKQTGRAASETIAERVRSDVEMLDWVFVGRCTGETETYSKILSYMDRNAYILGGISVFIGAKPDWRVIGVYFDKDQRKTAQGICEFLDYDFSKAKEVKVRDRRNLTKNLSDYDDPVADGVFLLEKTRRTIRSELMRKKCICLQGPPGTGKTVVGKSISNETALDQSRVLNLQFHQAYSYEDFVVGWRPSSEGNLRVLEGAFLKFCDIARENQGDPYVVFIDEINRANVSQVFGEVLSLIEATKRDGEFAVSLAYTDPENERTFFVPKNVFVVATMNTADRSLSIIDYALRRRFSFIDLEPAYGTAEFHEFLSRNCVPSGLIDEVSERFLNLNRVITEDTRALGPGFELGHSYFCGFIPKDQSPEDWYSNIVKHEIEPLLRDYWMDDEERVTEQLALLKEPLVIVPESPLGEESDPQV
ncbi:AAA domain (dynein-related subfamily) [Yoonia rosea]|uniref:AAA domain (Dynein-related subfamily) n=1 Tax=Yoonia rosea TaxID=287098 RepID=A0A1R3WWC1_9RHOB|nr:AAA family ATPase [Yoonia rosea]SIT82471.1 AAA domain (dynein-related subfamily) [Yoonia rosea]